MTQTLSKLTVVALLVSFAVPAFAHAEEGTNRPFQNVREKVEKKIENRVASTTRPNSGVGGQNFCANIDKTVSVLSGQMTKRDEGRLDRRENRGEKRDERQGLKDGKLDDRRDDRDENRAGRYDKLYARASTTEAKAAVDVFKAAVESAVSTRRTAVDAAIEKFRVDSQALITNQQAVVDAAAQTLKTSIDAAIAKAKADCTAGVDAATVRETLRKSIKDAQDIFKEKAKKPADIGSQLKALRETRDAAIKAAMDAFKTAFDAAVAALKTALGK